MVKINITYDNPSVLNVPVTRNIRRCVEATLKAEGITAPVEINILITDDSGIHAINLASRKIDRPTDVLSFPMFELVAGNPPKNWENYLDPGTGLCPLGDMEFLWSGQEPRQRNLATVSSGRLGI